MDMAVVGCYPLSPCLFCSRVVGVVSSGSGGRGGWEGGSGETAGECCEGRGEAALGWRR
jgi:hypothetical protein